MMAFETPLNKSKTEVTNEWVLAQLAERLKKVRVDLGLADENEDPGVIADDEDREEAGEEKDTRQAIGNELQKEEQEILGAIKWIGEHGDACAVSGCENKVESRRRQADPASITCIKHRNDEDTLLRDLAMGL